MAKKHKPNIDKILEKNLMNLIKKRKGVFADVGYKTITIEGKRFKMDDVRKSLENLRKKGKLEKRIVRNPRTKEIHVRTYYIPSMRKQAEENSPGYFKW